MGNSQFQPKTSAEWKVPCLNFINDYVKSYDEMTGIGQEKSWETVYASKLQNNKALHNLNNLPDDMQINIIRLIRQGPKINDGIAETKEEIMLQILEYLNDNEFFEIIDDVKTHHDLLFRKIYHDLNFDIDCMQMNFTKTTSDNGIIINIIIPCKSNNKISLNITI